MAYDAAQESTWCWLTAKHISDFYAPTYTRDDPPNTCLTLRKGHRPKMFLWMMEEFTFILCHLRKDDRDGALVLGHELLLLVCSRCYRKRGSCCAGPTPLDRLPACSSEVLECAVLVANTMQLECLAWAVFDNIMGPGETPPLSGFETYNQIVGHLTDKAYEGLHTHCPVRTSTSFGMEVSKPGLNKPDSKTSVKPRRYTIMRDVREEFAGSYSTLWERQDIGVKDKFAVLMPTVNPNIQGMKWMKERQCSYRDAQLDFWLLLRQLTDGSEESTHKLACRLLSVWHWSLAIDPPTYPPAPTSMNIRYWLWKSDEEDERQLWIEAYACALQRMAEASVGRKWISEKGIRVPKITRVVGIFLNATGTWVSPDKIRKCWPTRCGNIPVQSLKGMRQSVVRKLDEVAMRDTSIPIAWDQFAFPLAGQECWREEALCYHPGKMLNVGTCMPGFRLMLQDDQERYPHSGRALIFEGSMLVYDPQQDIAQWIPVCGTSATLTMPELGTAYDLNNFVPSPSSQLGPRGRHPLKE